MSEFDKKWDRLVRRVRATHGSDEPEAVPLGFVTRVLAARETAGNGGAWELIAMRSLIAACVVVLAIMVVSWPPFDDRSNADDLAELADPLTEVALLE